MMNDMTNEKTIEILEKEKSYMVGEGLEAQALALDKAIKALEEPNVNETLQKIRAEIKQKDFDFGDFYDHTETIREIVVEIIDKYKQESVLDKVRAEVKQLPITDTAIRLVTDIIDKYKAESEEV